MAEEVVEFNAGDVGFMIICAGLVWIMTPGLGYFYSGMARSKSALSLIMVCFLAIAVVSVQWWLFGFSLTFSETSGNPVIGDFKYAFGHHMVGPKDYLPLVPTLPISVFSIFQMMFAIITAGLIFGGPAERMRVLPTIIFIFIWTTFVYDPIAYWSWSENGWLRKLGSLDFAGGTPVHIASGAAGLAYSLVLGKRQGLGKEKFKPHNLSNVFLGTALLWCGWFGFNAGSALGANARAGMAFLTTNLSTAVGGITWVLIDYHREKKLSALGFCSGAVAGLVGITPGAGFVSPCPAAAIGLITATVCNFGIKIKSKIGIDDALDVFGVHCIGGITGNLLTGIFAQKYVQDLDGGYSYKAQGGWLDGSWDQLLYQFIGCVAGFFWSFCLTYLLLKLMDLIPGLSIRVEREAEVYGIDQSEMGEVAYDYVSYTQADLMNMASAVNINNNLPVENMKDGVKDSDITTSKA